MEFIKLQLGCLIVVLYIAFLYLKNKKTNQKSLFDFIIIISIIELFFDGATAYTVNHLDNINLLINTILHCGFLLSIDKEYLKIAYDIAVHHHDKWNGKGYPDALKENDIPLCARIMAIADVFDAVSEKRCYIDALPLRECFEIIKNGKGSDFDPLLVDIFLEIRPQI